MQQMLKVKDAALAANVSESTIRRMAAAHEIRHRRLRGVLRIYPDFLADVESEIDFNAYNRSLLARKRQKNKQLYGKKND